MKYSDYNLQLLRVFNCRSIITFSKEAEIKLVSLLNVGLYVFIYKTSPYVQALAAVACKNMHYVVSFFCDKSDYVSIPTDQPAFVLTYMMVFLKMTNHLHIAEKPFSSKEH